jgi:iron complex outermembrane receptor protein
VTLTTGSSPRHPRDARAAPSDITGDVGNRCRFEYGKGGKNEGEMIMRRSVLAAFWASGAAVTFVAAPAMAQVSSDDPAPAPDEDTTTIGSDEIIVTARKREERLKDVPVAITVLDDRALRDLGANDIVDVAQLTPGLAMQDNSRQNEQPFMRGMSVNSFFPDAQNASFFHDGIFVTGTSRTLGQEDVQRIEVVKGPQAVYFGRQTFAGAINYVTKKPTFDFHAHATASFAENQDYRMAFGVSGPIVSDVLAVRLYGQISTDDGAFQNTLDGFRAQTEQTVGGSASVTLRASDSIEFTGRAQYVEFDDGHNSSVLIGANLNNCLPNTAGLNQA